jgi:hypothetical protein
VAQFTLTALCDILILGKHLIKILMRVAGFFLIENLGVPPILLLLVIKENFKFKNL